MGSSKAHDKRSLTFEDVLTVAHRSDAEARRLKLSTRINLEFSYQDGVLQTINRGATDYGESALAR